MHLLSRVFNVPAAAAAADALVCIQTKKVKESNAINAEDDIRVWRLPQ